MSNMFCWRNFSSYNRKMSTWK